MKRDNGLVQRVKRLRQVICVFSRVQLVEKDQDAGQAPAGIYGHDVAVETSKGNSFATFVLRYQFSRVCSTSIISEDAEYSQHTVDTYKDLYAEMLVEKSDQISVVCRWVQSYVPSLFGPKPFLDNISVGVLHPCKLFHRSAASP